MATHPCQQRPRATSGPAPAPCLADGIELVGEYEGSGYKEPHFLARRADGQVIQISQLLYLVAEACDGERGTEEIAEVVSERFGRRVSADNVDTLVEKLRPLGVLAQADGSSPPVAKLDPLLALRFRAQLVSPRAVQRLAVPFRPLFLTPVMATAIAAWLATIAWLFFVHGVGQGLRDALYEPAIFLLVLGLVVVSAGFHEFGHAAACSVSGAKPGGMGAGIYLAWPAFYTDVTDAYRLSRAGRLRTDLGGVYFNVLISLATMAVYAVTSFEPLLLLVAVQQLEIFHQLLPFLRMDGYYVVADLTGVPDLFLRTKPILRSLLPWRKPDDRVTELKAWVRVVVSLWVVVVIPLLLFNLGVIVLHLPRIAATAWDSLQLQLDRGSDALSGGDVLGAVAGLLQAVILVLPLAGIAYTLVRTARRAGAGVWRWSDGRPAARPALGLGMAALAGLALYVWIPNGDYQPLQPGERYTVQEVAASVRDVPSGRPGLSAGRERALGTIERRAEPEEADATGPVASTTTTTSTTSTVPATSTTVARGSSGSNGTPTTSVTEGRATTTTPRSTTTSSPATTTTDPTTTTTETTVAREPSRSSSPPRGS